MMRRNQYDRLTFAEFPSASVEVASVSPNASIITAESLMRRHDFSQLAVATGPRRLEGAVTWESIARKASVRRVDTVAECAFEVPTVLREEPLLAHVDEIVKSGFTFVANRDRTLGGIVTVYDMAERFAEVARPLVVLAEIEGRLRDIIRSHFTSEELGAVRAPGTGSGPRSPEELTLGECERILENPARWDRLGWSVDRKIFIGLLDSVRVSRNRLVHFAEGGDGEDPFAEMSRLLDWLRDLET